MNSWLRTFLNKPSSKNLKKSDVARDALEKAYKSGYQAGRAQSLNDVMQYQEEEACYSVEEALMEALVAYLIDTENPG